MPTAVTILGVLMFLREGWVVGNAGFGGAVLIILLAFLITGSTGLCLSSVTTNIRIGAGGAYSIISKSLGLEIAGSIGIPLYLAQTLAVTLYIFAGIGRRRLINVWVRNPEWERGHEIAEIDLALLLAYKLQVNWNGRVRLLTSVDSVDEKEGITAEQRLVDLARVPRAEVYALTGPFQESVTKAPQADLSLFGLPTDIDFRWAARMVESTRSACLFVRGSGEESAVA